MAWRVAHWQLLNGDKLDVDPDDFHALEERMIDHTGRYDNPSAHARADQAGLERGAELAAVEIPTLVIEAPADPINPPPARQRTSPRPSAAPGWSRSTGMGHALPPDPRARSPTPSSPTPPRSTPNDPHTGIIRRTPDRPR